jgi:hypothetical protein
MEACKISRTSIRTLLIRLVSGLGWPVLLLAVEILVILRLRFILSPLWTVIAAIVSGCVYFLFWGYRTALPLYRNRAETVAQ